MYNGYDKGLITTRRVDHESLTMPAGWDGDE